ncbi:MAG: DNA topoisomerase I [Acidilobaceae archaeon]
MSQYKCRLPANYIVLIAEKPRAGERIAKALNATPLKCSINGIPYWILRVNTSNLIIVSSAGHLFGLYTSYRGFPVFDYTWRPIWEFDSKASHLKKFYKTLEVILPKASSYISACDYDIEGSVICYKIIEALGDPSRSQRMKFSALAVKDITVAFNNLQPLDREMIEAGLARSELDWLWGINVSRALMEAVKVATGRKVVLSAGRVQSPTLVEAVKRWEDINLHVPQPKISLVVSIRRGRLGFKARLVDSSILTKRSAEGIKREILESRRLIVDKYIVSSEHVDPPPAFNLGDLQREAARIYGLSPMKTQEIAEDLYLEALISYPRTNSQKLPSTIDYMSIMSKLENNPEYSSLVKSLLIETSGVLKPVQGKMDDPAHPAIYPTGEKPNKLSNYQKLIYDLIVRRFLAAFSKRAIIVRQKTELRDSTGRVYEAYGVRVISEGWLRYYPFLKPRELILPELSRGDTVVIDNVKLIVAWSKPPIGISKISLLKWMESVEIGTESTRARIIETLFKRNYLKQEKGRVIVTDLGYTIAYIIRELFPELSTVDLTRNFEKKLEDIRYNRVSRRNVIDEAKKTLINLIASYKLRLNKVGEDIAVALKAKQPIKPCIICGRESLNTIKSLNLCNYHHKALAKLREILPKIEGTLEIQPEKAIEILANKRRLSGKWVIDIASRAQTDYKLRELILRPE